MGKQAAAQSGESNLSKYTKAIRQSKAISKDSFHPRTRAQLKDNAIEQARQLKKLELEKFIAQFKQTYHLAGDTAAAAAAAAAAQDGYKNNTQVKYIKRAYSQLHNKYYHLYYNTTPPQQIYYQQYLPFKSEEKKNQEEYEKRKGFFKKYKAVDEQNKVLGLVGLRNLGNTCYMNSAVYCLSNLYPLADYCMNNYHEKELNLHNKFGSGGLVATAFSNLIREIWHTRAAGALQAEEFYKVVCYERPQYAQNTQEDAYEFLVYLLDALHEDLNRVDIKPSVEFSAHSAQLSDAEQEQLAAQSWKMYLMRNKSVIIDLFQGQLKNTLTCLECHHQSYKFEPFMYLSLPLEARARGESSSLEECLNEFLREEILEGDERWQCPHCERPVRTKKKIDLWKLPSILIFTLKRFKHNKRENKKILTRVEFPINSLELTRFLPQSLQKTMPIYDLFAACCHNGGLSYGHYTTYAKSKENFSWHHFNDSHVTAVEDPAAEIPRYNVYMLFYQKSTIELIKRQSVTEPMNWPHKL